MHNDSDHPGANFKSIFYQNIGKEPYIINKYVRPKGLSSFRMVPNRSEAELEYAKRMKLFKLEQDLRGQYEILSN